MSEEEQPPTAKLAAKSTPAAIHRMGDIWFCNGNSGPVALMTEASTKAKHNGKTKASQNAAYFQGKG